jgi:dolichyl-phosphate-mannose--protein O-mannosyl transferase
MSDMEKRLRYLRDEAESKSDAADELGAHVAMGYAVALACICDRKWWVFVIAFLLIIVAQVFWHQYRLKKTYDAWWEIAKHGPDEDDD